MSDVIIRPIEIEKDAKGLAAMWNASDVAWPGSWTRGVPITAAIVREWEESGRTVVTFVAGVTGEIAGYCSFMEGHRGRKGEGYLSLLNVHPRYQKQGIGRRLIQATIERSVQVGWKRQTLSTWAGNFKAMPAYKKTGHFWIPDTSAQMDNFIPGALQMPLARPFFDRHDWYKCYVREVTQEEDDERWEGLKVYTQRWEAEGESLTIWIDREARAPVAVETDALLVAAIAEDIEPFAGSSVALRWRVVNKGQEPLSVFLHATGDKGLVMDHHDAWVVPVGATGDRVAQVQVADDAPSSKDDGTAPAVRSLLRVNNQEVELFSGMRARKLVSLDTAPAQITLTPGVPGAINLQLHSQLPQAVEARLYLAPPEGVMAEWTSKRMELPAEGHVSMLLALTTPSESVYDLPVRVEFPGAEGIKPLAETLPLFSLGAAGLLARRQGDSVRLEIDALRITVEGKGGAIQVEYKDVRLRMASLGVALGPPYYPSDLEKTSFDLTLSQRNGRAVIHMAGESGEDAGLWLHQELALSPTGLCTLRYYLENRGSAARTRRLRLGVRTSGREREQMTFPLALGTVHGPAPLYPDVWEDAPRDPSDYAEPWISWQRGGAVAGIAWGGAIAKVDLDWGVGLITQELTVGPGERSREVGFALYAGRGDWTAVQEAALRWAGAWQPQKGVLATRPPALARIEPTVVATTSDQATGHLVVNTASGRVTSGKVTIDTEDGLSSEPRMMPVDDLVRGTPFERDLLLRLAEGKLGVFRGAVHLSLPLSHEARPFYVVRLGSGSPVSVAQGEREGQEIWTVNNGVSTFEVVPGFGPSLIAWHREGINHLHTAFPEARGLAWAYPWFGGVSASLRPAGRHGPNCLHRERFTAQPVEAPDRHGLTWQGVRITGNPTKKDLAELRIELDFLTLGDSSVLKYVYRLCNLRDTVRAARAGTSVACCLGTEPAELVLHGEGVWREPTPWGTRLEGARWGALANPHTGTSLLMVARQPDVLLNDLGQDGRQLGASDEIQLEPHQVREQVYYLVLADSLDGARSHIVLKDYAG